MKQCTKCGETKPIIEYHRDKNTKDGHVQRCKSCVKIKTQKWRQENLEKEKASQRAKYRANPEYYKTKARQWIANNKDKKIARDREYQINNPHVYRATKQRRKIRKAENGEYVITKKEWQKLYSSPCVYCGDTKDIQADHVIPIIKGGIHGISNLVPACKGCNSSKRERFITEWKKAKKNP